MLSSRLTDVSDENPAVAISTTVSQTVTGMMGSFWEQVRAGDYPVESVIRPKLELRERNTRQPLVQVQCSGYSLETIRNLTTRDNRAGGNVGINTFSTTNASAIPVPDWLYDYDYKVPMKLFVDDLGRVSIGKSETTNLTWLEPPEKSNLSAIAMITVPFAYYSDDVTEVQTAMFHFCSVDARWVGSKHSYDPTEDVHVAHNITDPLVFQKPQAGTDGSYKDDIMRLGISPALKLSTEWSQAINVEVERGNLSAPSFNWILTPYITLDRPEPVSGSIQQMNETGPQAVYFIFTPGTANLFNATGQTSSVAFHTHASNTLATLLSLHVTDALSRLRSFSIYSGRIVTSRDTPNSTIWPLVAFAGSNSFSLTNTIASALLDQVTNRWIISVERYGYGFGFRTATVYFGIIILLAHIALVLIYILYAFYDFFYLTQWTSSAWGGIAEFAALLINSKQTKELQNTCAGVDASETWRRNVWIREVEDDHLGIVVGNDDGLVYRHARSGEAYGNIGLNYRRRSI